MAEFISLFGGTGLAFLAVFLVNKGWALWENKKKKA